jgi:hypothetical protein
MTAMFEVQDGVPLPEINRAPKVANRKYPLTGMLVGSMFFVPHRTAKSVSAYISRISKNLPARYSARHCWMIQNDNKWVMSYEGADGAVEGTGVWRIE